MNQNRGETIFIRLRPADDKSSFLPLEESLVGTLLHEFTHNVHGPHHKQFYEFLDKLQDEYEVLRTSGYSGDGFFSDGRKAGSSRDLPPHLAREKGLQAAQRRQQINSIMGSAGGNRLGPGKSTLGKTPKQMAAESAERRASDDKTCGQGTNVSGVSVEEEMDKAKKENTTLVRPSSSSKPTAIASVVMTSGNDSVGADTDNSDDSDIEILVFAAAAASTSTNRQEPNKRSTAEASGITLDTGRPSKAMKRNPQSWICAACTFSNENLFGLACEVCGTERRSTEHDFPVNPATRTGWIPVLKEKPRAPVKISTMTW